MENKKRDQQIEDEYNAFMQDVMDSDYEGDFSEYGFEQPTPEIELSFTDISEEITLSTETVVTPAPRRVFTESRQRFSSKAQEGYSMKLAMQIRDLLKSKFGEDTSANQWHKNFSIDTKLEILEELKAGRNFNTKS